MRLEDYPDLEKKVFSELGVAISRKLEGGLVNTVYYVELRNGISGTLRVSDALTESWIARKERATLFHFHGVPFFPALISQGECKDANVLFNLITFFEGMNMAALDEVPSSDVFSDLGKTLGRIQSHRTTEFGFVYDFNNIGADPRIHNSYPGPYKNGFEQHFMPAQGWVNHLVSKGSRYSEQLQRILAKMANQENIFLNGECTYNHGDYGFNNILTFPDRLVGIIDFDSFTFGDPASDIHQFLQDCIDKEVPAGSILSFVEGYTSIRPLPHNFCKKSSFYRRYAGIREVIMIPFRLGKIPRSKHAEYGDQLLSFLEKIAEEDDYLEEISHLTH